MCCLNPGNFKFCPRFWNLIGFLVYVDGVKKLSRLCFIYNNSSLKGQRRGGVPEGSIAQPSNPLLRPYIMIRRLRPLSQPAKRAAVRKWTSNRAFEHTRVGGSNLESHSQHPLNTLRRNNKGISHFFSFENREESQNLQKWFSTSWKSLT